MIVLRNSFFTGVIKRKMGRLESEKHFIDWFTYQPPDLLNLSQG